MSVAAGQLPTVAAALADATTRLAAAGVEDARREARLLLAAVLTGGMTAVVAGARRALTEGETHDYTHFVDRRAAREPAAHLFGRAAFWTLDLAVDARVLVPRADSETLVEALLEVRPQGKAGAGLRVLDLGTGSGCLALALAAEWPGARVDAVDASDDALDVARANVARLGLGGRVACHRGNWGADIVGSYDVIVANPPYIASAEIAGLAPEVARFEPRTALDGGLDGLDGYRALMPDVARLLASGGVAALEVGAGQATGVESVAKAAGLAPAGRRRDLGGHERCVLLTCN
ncbi:MAG: peptide chain release factor N(5)-glutamine methyltransferase [Alphaproteobacteria bacterium]